MLSNRFETQYKEQLRRYADYKKDVRYFWIAYKASYYGTILFIILIFVMASFNILPSMNYAIFSLEWFLTYMNVILFLFVPIIGLPSRFFIKRRRKKHRFSEIKISFIHMFTALKSYEEWSDKKIESDRDKSLNNLKKSYKIIERWDYDKAPLFTKDIKDNMNLVQYKLKNFLLNRIMHIKDDSQISITIQILYRLNSFLYYNNSEYFNELIDYINVFEKEIKKREYEYLIDRIKPVIYSNKSITYMSFIALVVSIIYYFLAGYLKISHYERLNQIVLFLIFGIIVDIAKRFIYDESKYEEK